MRTTTVFHTTTKKLRKFPVNPSFLLKLKRHSGELMVSHFFRLLFNREKRVILNLYPFFGLKEPHFHYHQLPCNNQKPPKMKPPTTTNQIVSRSRQTLTLRAERLYLRLKWKLNCALKNSHLVLAAEYLLNDTYHLFSLLLYCTDRQILCALHYLS